MKREKRLSRVSFFFGHWFKTKVHRIFLFLKIKELFHGSELLSELLEIGCDKVVEPSNLPINLTQALHCDGHNYNHL
jgi:hypothetical protein